MFLLLLSFPGAELDISAVIPPLLPCGPSSSLSFSEGGKKNSLFLHQCNSFLPLLQQPTCPCWKSELSLVWEGASRLGQGAPSSFRISAPAQPHQPLAWVPGLVQLGAPGGQQAASLAQRLQPALSGAETLLVALTSTSQEVCPPTQSQLYLCVRYSFDHALPWSS